MSTYSSVIDTLLKKFEGAHNHLLQYDNYNYHIKFFMVDKETQKSYSRRRYHTMTEISPFDNSSQDAIEAKALLNNHQVIIAETGKTNDLFVESLSIQSVPALGDEHTHAATQEFHLKIREVAGNGLVNKIHITANLLGYRSYMCTPLFLEIWFDGYENTDNGKPIGRIPNMFGKESTMIYQVMIEKATVTNGDNSTLYDFLMRPISDIGLFSDFSSNKNFKIGELFPNDSFGEILKKIQDQKNAELREAWKDVYDGIYNKTEYEIIDRCAPNYEDQCYEELGEDAVQEVATESSVGDAFIIQCADSVPDYPDLLIKVEGTKSKTRKRIEDLAAEYDAIDDEKDAEKAIEDYNKSGLNGAINTVSEAISYGNLMDQMNNNDDFIKSLFKDNKWSGDAGDKALVALEGVMRFFNFIGWSTIIGARTYIYKYPIVRTAEVAGATIDTAAEIAITSNVAKNNAEKRKSIKEQIDSALNSKGEAGTWASRKITIEPEKQSNITSLITEIFRVCFPYSKFEPAYTFVPEYMADYNGASYYRVKLIITFQEIPGIFALKDYTDNNIPDKELLGYSRIIKSVDDFQKYYLGYVLAAGSLLKKYRWLLNGVEENVLEYTSDEDNFWYLNSPLCAEDMAIQNTAGATTDTKELGNIVKEDTLRAMEIANVINRKIGGDSNGHPDININEFANMVDAETSKLIKDTYMIMAQRNDLNIEMQSVASVDSQEKQQNNALIEQSKMVNKSYQVAKIAAENMLSHGQKIKLNLKIIGDPYWLTFTSESIQISQRSFPHLIMDIKTFSKLDGMDNPKEDESMRFISLYRITKITSNFEEGKFVQDLEGFIATPFAGGFDPEFWDEEGSMSDKDGMTHTIMKSSRGNIRVLGLDPTDSKEINSKVGDMMKSYKEGNTMNVNGYSISSLKVPEAQQATNQETTQE